MSNKKMSSRQAARKLVVRTNPQSISTEQYRTIRTNILFSMPADDMKTILFTSPSKEEGKSTTCSNMAIVFAESGKKVLMIDADMRRPTLHHTFHMSNKSGISNLLLGKGRLADTVRRSGIKNLDLLLCGQIPVNPAELLQSSAMDDLLEQVCEIYDLILIDSPPLLAVADSKILANKCDGSVLVVNTGKTEKASVIKARDALVTSKAYILGVVLNNFDLAKNHMYYQNYGS